MCNEKKLRTRTEVFKYETSSRKSITLDIAHNKENDLTTVPLKKRRVEPNEVDGEIHTAYGSRG